MKSKLPRRRRPASPNQAKPFSTFFAGFQQKTNEQFKKNRRNRTLRRQRRLQHLQSKSAAKQQNVALRKFVRLTWLKRYQRRGKQSQASKNISRNLGDWFWPRIAENPSTRDAAARVMRSAAAALPLLSLITLVISAIPLKLTTANWYLEVLALIGQSIPILVLSCVLALLSLTLDSNDQVNRAYRGKLLGLARIGYILALLLLPLQLGLLAWLYVGTFDIDRNQRNAVVANSEALIAGAQQTTTTEQFIAYLGSRNLNINAESIRSVPLNDVKAEFVRSVKQQQQQQEDRITTTTRTDILRYAANGSRLFAALGILSFFLRGFQSYIKGSSTGSSIQLSSSDELADQPEPSLTSSG
jgi:hypothetical protein